MIRNDSILFVSFIMCILKSNAEILTHGIVLKS